MELIRDSCGDDSMLEETLFGRVCERCNTSMKCCRRGVETEFVITYYVLN